MADSFTFMVGDLDLSDHVRVSPGEGLEPYARELVEPLFSESPLREGGRLIDTNVPLEPRVFPLFLNDGSAPQLRALEQSINRELDRAPGLPMEWRPPGSGSSTFYDIEFGRFEPDYNFRRDQAAWQGGVLRLWTQPYGHGTDRVVATGMATGVAAAVFAIPSSLAGDVDALADIRLAVGSHMPLDGRLVGVAPLPHASYQAVIPANLLNLAGGSLSSASGAHASQFLRWTTNPARDAYATFALGHASLYQGQRHRLVAVARGDVELFSVDHDRNRGNPGIASVFTRDWGLVDLDVVSVPDVPTAILGIGFEARRHNDGGRLFTEQIVSPGVPRDGPHITALLLLPEGETVIVLDRDEDLLAQERFPPTNLPGTASPVTTNDTADDVGNRWQIPDQNHFPWAGTAALVRTRTDGYGEPFNVGAASKTLQTFGQLVPVPSTADTRIEAMIEDAALMLVPTCTLSLVKYGASSGAGGALVAEAQGNASGLTLRLIGHTLGATLVVGTAFVASNVLGNDWLLTLNTRGQGAWAALEAMDLNSLGGILGLSNLVASVGGQASKYAQNAGFPGYHFRATAMGSAVDIRQFRVNSFRAAAITQRELGPRDTYQLDTVSERRRRYSSASARTGDVDGDSKGGLITLSAPSTPAVAVFALPLPRGPAGGVLSVEVRARERFRFARA